MMIMANLLKLNFNITVECQEESAKDLGRDLAVFLRESWFNGEDVLNVEFVSYEVLE